MEDPVLFPTPPPFSPREVPLPSELFKRSVQPGLTSGSTPKKIIRNITQREVSESPRTLIKNLGDLENSRLFVQPFASRSSPVSNPSSLLRRLGASDQEPPNASLQDSRSGSNTAAGSPLSVSALQSKPSRLGSSLSIEDVTRSPGVLSLSGAGPASSASSFAHTSLLSRSLSLQQPPPVLDSELTARLRDSEQEAEALRNEYQQRESVWEARLAHLLTLYDRHDKESRLTEEHLRTLLKNSELERERLSVLEAAVSTHTRITEEESIKELEQRVAERRAQMKFTLTGAEAEPTFEIPSWMRTLLLVLLTFLCSFSLAWFVSWVNADPVLPGADWSTVGKELLYAALNTPSLIVVGVVRLPYNLLLSLRHLLGVA